MIRLLEEKESKYVLSNNYIGYLGYIYKDEPFIAPITYYYSSEKNIIIGYSDEGHKIAAMRKHNRVCLEVAEVDSINHWESAQAHGTFKEVFGSTSKAYLHEFSLGIKHLITRKEKQNLSFISEFSSKISKSERPVVFIIDILDVTGRMRRH
jgi:nitroimidazol reductase NimA-like FMN-containing flavoprotein (pyridoxamine 5'-phosphate oxidase superfamily)